MHRLEANILHHANKRREQRKYLYKEIEIDDDITNYFNNISVYLKQHNECFLTNYKTLEEFNENEPYRIIIKLY